MPALFSSTCLLCFSLPRWTSAVIFFFISSFTSVSTAFIISSSQQCLLFRWALMLLLLFKPQKKQKLGFRSVKLLDSTVLKTLTGDAFTPFLGDRGSGSWLLILTGDFPAAKVKQFYINEFHHVQPYNENSNNKNVSFRVQKLETCKLYLQWWKGQRLLGFVSSAEFGRLSSSFRLHQPLSAQCMQLFELSIFQSVRTS